MKKIHLLFISISLLFSVNVMAQNHKSDDIIGKWLTENNESKVEIYKIGEKYYGKIVWLKDPNDKETGKPKKDKNNTDIKLKERPVLGLSFVNGFKFNGDNKWEDGTVYDPKSGKTYNGFIAFESKDKLKLRGYIGKAWMGLGRTTYWTKTN
ncbi:MAG: DUF2147 domain-containing protein [Bacteroidetes bacterium]|nr:DUF2147 domain-containing protein [Bacteroidota bacterium]